MESITSKEVFKIFQQYKDRKFIFVEPGGNQGDYLIYKGAEKVARIADINYQSVTKEEFMQCRYPEDSIVYIHGCGGYVPYWTAAPEIFIKAITTHLGIVIVGPSTFSEDLGFLKNALNISYADIKSEEIIVFAREKTSYFALSKILPINVKLNIDHDTAFNLDIADILKKVPRRRYILQVIRRDKESTQIKKNNLLSVCLDPADYKWELNLKQWVFLHSRAKKIVTNRLHSAIIGTLLGIPVTIMPNSYHKNRSVWEYSLSKFNVDWSEEMPVSKNIYLIKYMPILNKVINSNLCQRFFRIWYGTGYKALHSQKVDNFIAI